MDSTRRAFLTAAVRLWLRRRLPPRLRAVAHERSLSRSRRRASRSELRQVSPRACQRRADRHGHALERGAGVVRRRPLPAVERHPQQPHHALAGGDGRGQRLPPALQQRQRQHPRPPGPARHLRARHAPGHAHRVRRHHHRHHRQVRRQAAQLAQRRRRQVRRLDLVHRSAVRHPRQLRGPRGHARAADQRLPLRPQDRPRHGRRRRHQPAERARLLARRDEAVRRRGRPPRRASSKCSTSPTTAPSSPTAASSSPPSPAARPTASASTSTAICGAAGAWATRSRTA